VSYEVYVGDVGELHVLHKCDNPGCVNPDHLFLGTHIQNMKDKANKKRASNKRTTPKLTIGQVKAIREDTRSHRKIAQDYGVSHGNIWYIKQGLTWRLSEQEERSEEDTHTI
jgi:hypothetical protein